MWRDGPDILARADFAAVLDALDDETIVVDGRGVIVAANAAWRAFCRENDGDDTRHYLGENYFDACRQTRGEGVEEAQSIPRGLAEVMQTGLPYRVEYPCATPNRQRWFEMVATRILLDGAPFALVQHRDITRYRMQQLAADRASLDASAMSALVATTSEAILTFGLDGRILTWNPAAEDLYGYTSTEAIGQSLTILYPRDWPHKLDYYIEKIIAGELERFEAVRIGKDGVAHDVWISCAPIRDSKGRVVAISNIHRDVTELRRAERAREVIAGEVIHRSKNMLGIVSAIQRQTARTESTLEGFHRSFGARIQALAKSTDLLVGESWTTVRLRDLIEGHLEAFVETRDPRVSLDGPAIDLEPQAVQTIGMAIHELATNSAKYGALRGSEGRVALVWTVEPVDDARELRLSWEETGLAERPSGTRKGFGSTVLTTLAPSMLDAKTTLEHETDRVGWCIAVPEPHFRLG